MMNYILLNIPKRNEQKILDVIKYIRFLALYIASAHELSVGRRVSKGLRKISLRNKYISLMILTEQGILNSFSYTNSDYGLRNFESWVLHL